MIEGLSITVPQSLYDAISLACGVEAADSYLWGANLIEDRLTPHTVYAYHWLDRDYSAKKALKALNIVLIRPTPFPGKNGEKRMSIVEALPDYFLGKPRKGARRNVEQW